MAQKRWSYWAWTDEAEGLVKVEFWNGFTTEVKASFPYANTNEEEQCLLLAEDLVDDLEGVTGESTVQHN